MTPNDGFSNSPAGEKARRNKAIGRELREVTRGKSKDHALIAIEDLAYRHGIDAIQLRNVYLRNPWDHNNPWGKV